LVQFARGSVPEEALASTHAQARAVCRTRCFSGSTLLLLSFTFFISLFALAIGGKQYRSSVSFVSEIVRFRFNLFVV